MCVHEDYVTPVNKRMKEIFKFERSDIEGAGTERNMIWLSLG